MGQEIIEVVVKSDKGRVKKVNEDNFLIKVGKINNNEFGLFAICDGLGGLSNGDLASKEMVLELEKWWNNRIANIVSNNIVDRDILVELSCVIRDVNRKLIKYASDNNIRLGTTASILLIYNRKFYVCHIGDSRIYTISSSVNKLTKDHTYYNKLIQDGEIEESKKVKKSILTQCVGSGPSISPDFLVGRLNKDVLFILCCDGFYNKMSDREFMDMKNELEETSDYGYMGEICTKYIELIKGKGERDNITVMAIKYRVNEGE